MDVHPWTKYEVARLRDEARLLRAREAMRAIEMGHDNEGEPQALVLRGPESLIDRLRRLGLATRRAPAGSGV